MLFPLPHPRKRGAYGFGLCDIILVGATVLTAAAVVVAVFHSARPSAAAAMEASNVTALVANLKSTHAAHPNYANATPAQAIQDHLVPMGLIDPQNSTGGLRSQWGAVTLEPVRGSTPAQFEVRYANVPSEACPKFVGGLNLRLFDRVSFNGDTLATTPHTPTPEVISRHCGDGAPTSFVTVALVSH